MSTLAEGRKAREEYKRIVQRKSPGEGSRFKAIVRIAELGGAKNPKAVAAAIGIRKYGKRQMQRWAKEGRQQKRRKR